MTFRESDGRIIPTKLEYQSSGQKPGNAGVGKAARVSRDSDRAPPVLRDGPAVITRLNRITTVVENNRAWHRGIALMQSSIGMNPPAALARLEVPFVTSETWEPDALTAHVRI